MRASAHRGVELTPRVSKRVVGGGLFQGRSIQANVGVELKGVSWR